jgi:hypothetical protein
LIFTFSGRKSFLAVTDVKGPVRVLIDHPRDCDIKVCSARPRRRLKLDHGGPPTMVIIPYPRFSVLLQSKGPQDFLGCRCNNLGMIEFHVTRDAKSERSNKPSSCKRFRRRLSRRIQRLFHAKVFIKPPSPA